MHRRTFLYAIAAGAVVTAEGLWVPGQKLISIPKTATPFVFGADQGAKLQWISSQRIFAAMREGWRMVTTEEYSHTKLTSPDSRHIYHLMVS